MCLPLQCPPPFPPASGAALTFGQLTEIKVVAGTFKEILTIATDTSQKDVGRTFNIINRDMGDKWAAEQPQAHVKDFMRRFCNQLGLEHRDVVVAEEFALAACPRDGMWVLSPPSLSSSRVDFNACVADLLSQIWAYGVAFGAHSPAD